MTKLTNKHRAVPNAHVERSSCWLHI